MAKSSKVSAVFTSDPSGLELGIKRAQKALRELRGESSGLRTSMTSLNKAVSLNTFVQLGTLAAAAIGKFSTQVQYAIGQATDLGEELSKSSQIFGENAGEIERFANSAASLGFTKVAALQAAGSFGNMFTAMRLSNAQSAEMSLTFTKLAADMASFNNTSVDDAVRALGAALRGESEPIRRFGVLLDDATLRAKAFELGMTSSAKDAMTPAIKAQAAYAAILSQTAKAQGDFARTSGGLANMGRVMQAEVGNLATELGNVFVPVLESFGSAITSILQAVTPIVAEAANTLVAGWNAVGPAVISTFWDGSELFARTFDIVVSALGAFYNVFGNAFGAVTSLFSSLLPEWVKSIDWWAVTVEVFQRAISLFEGIGKGLAGVFRLILAGVNGVLSLIFAGLREGARLVGFSGETFDRLANKFNDGAVKQLNLAIDNFGESGGKIANAFSSKFEATDFGKQAVDVLSNGMQGGFESFIEKTRASWSEMPKATQAAAVQVAGQMGGIAVEAAKAVVKETSAILAGTTGSSSYIAGLINKTGSSVEKRQLAAAERTADGIDQIVGKVGLEAVSIA